jgi:hypothetical protein
MTLIAVKVVSEVVGYNMTSRLHRWIKHILIGIRFILKGPLPRLREKPIPEFNPTVQMEEALVQQRIKFVGKQVQCSIDGLSDDKYGRGLCYDVEIRVCDNSEIDFVYFIQDSKGHRNRSLNATIIE